MVMAIKKTQAISKRWEAKLKKLDEEHPDIQPNTFQFIYAGSDDFWFDLNNRYDPTDDWIDELDGDQPPPPPPKDTVGREKLAHSMLKALDRKERKIVKAHLFENKSFAQIGREMNCTRQNVKYHYDKSLAKLRDKFNDKN